MNNPPLLVGLLIKGVAYAAIFIPVVALVDRFLPRVEIHRDESYSSGGPAEFKPAPAPR